MTGEIKYFDKGRHFGIIIPEGVGVSLKDRDRHVFFYEDVLQGGTPYVGQQVEYSLNPNCRNPRALNVRLLDKTAYVPIDQKRRAVASGD
jgi:cold shock CspA family protein